MIKGDDRIRTSDMGQIPKKVNAGRPRMDAGTNETSADLSVGELTDSSTTKPYSD